MPAVYLPIQTLPPTPSSYQEEKDQTNDAPLEGLQRERAALRDLETFNRDPCDIVPLLDSHSTRDRFTAGRGGEEIQFATSWPLCCDVGVNAIKGRVAGKIGVAPVVSACIWAGIGNLRHKSRADELVSLKETFGQRSAEVSGSVADAVQSQFKGIVFNLPKTAGGKKADTLKVRVPEYIRNYVVGLSGDLGVPVNHLSVLAVMTTLIHQSAGIINPDHRREMEETLASFVGAVETQVRIVGAIMREFDLIEPPSIPPPNQYLEPQYQTYPTG